MGFISGKWPTFCLLSILFTAVTAVSRTGIASIPSSINSETRPELRSTPFDIPFDVPGTIRTPAKSMEAKKMQQTIAAYLAHDYSKSERLCFEIAEECKKETPRDCGKLSAFLALAGYCSAATGNIDRAQQYVDEAATFTEKSTTPLEWAYVSNLQGRLILFRGDYAKAEALFREVISIQSKRLGARSLATLESHYCLGDTLYREGKYEEAVSEYYEVYRSLKRILGPNNLSTLACRRSLAAALCDAGKYADSEAEYRALLKQKLGKNSPKPEDPVILESRAGLAFALECQGKAIEAEAEYRSVLKIEEQILGPRNFDTLGVMFQ